jgi:hypothetical protein
MYRCSRCNGFVPKSEGECPNCRSTSRAWWLAPVAFATAGFATVTLSACYGAPCAAHNLPDGGTDYLCGEIHCNNDGGTLPDGGTAPSDGGTCE